jgi:hypothetical protein
MANSDKPSHYIEIGAIEAEALRMCHQNFFFFVIEVPAK